MCEKEKKQKPLIELIM